MLINEINAGTFSPGNFVKSMLLGKSDQSKPLLAATDIAALDEQTAADQIAVNSAALSPEQCKQTTFTKEELSGDMKKAIVTNEDV